MWTISTGIIYTVNMKDTMMNAINVAVEAAQIIAQPVNVNLVNVVLAITTVVNVNLAMTLA